MHDERAAKIEAKLGIIENKVGRVESCVEKISDSVSSLNETVIKNSVNFVWAKRILFIILTALVGTGITVGGSSLLAKSPQQVEKTP